MSEQPTPPHKSVGQSGRAARASGGGRRSAPKAAPQRVADSRLGARSLLKLAVFLFAASCGGGRFDAPKNLDDACAIVAERPRYLTAMRQAERRWGIPVPVQMATIHQESKFIGDARTPHQYVLGVIPIGRQSSAYGYSQAIDDTWSDYQKATGKRGARRDRIADATDFMGWYMNGSSEALGISKSDAESQCLAYHEGRGGFSRGTHFSKPWLLSVAVKVGARADRYRSQLAACGKL